MQVETDLRNLGCNLIQTAGKLLKLPQVRYTTAGVGDPGHQDPHVFGPPGSVRCTDPAPLVVRIRLRILSFSHKGVDQTEKLLAK
jgi:hypothetical protein